MYSNFRSYLVKLWTLTTRAETSNSIKNDSRLQIPHFLESQGFMIPYQIKCVFRRPIHSISDQTALKPRFYIGSIALELSNSNAWNILIEIGSNYGRFGARISSQSAKSDICTQDFPETCLLCTEHSHEMILLRIIMLCRLDFKKGAMLIMHELLQQLDERNKMRIHAILKFVL